MALYDALKDAASVVNKAQNVELYQTLLDAQQQALELQSENAELKKKIEELQDMRELEEKIIRHKSTFITIKRDNQEIPYCSICWDTDKKTVQLQGYYEDDGRFNYSCIVCKNADKSLYQFKSLC